MSISLFKNVIILTSYILSMTAVTSAQQAIKIAKEVILDAGYEKFKIKNADYDEDEGVWTVEADSDDAEIDLRIDAESGEVTEFNT